MSHLSVFAVLSSEPVCAVMHVYHERDTDLAHMYGLRDAELDATHFGLLMELLTYKMEDARSTIACTHRLFMAENIERIGDHATNIAVNGWFAGPSERLHDLRKHGVDASGVGWPRFEHCRICIRVVSKSWVPVGTPVPGASTATAYPMQPALTIRPAFFGSSMSIRLGIFLIVLASAIVLAIAVALHALHNPDRYIPKITANLQQKTGLEVQIRHIESICSRRCWSAFTGLK